jgi:DNA-binding NtrC family response regulator
VIEGATRLIRVAEVSKMLARSVPELPIAPSLSRKVTITETCDLAAIEVSGEAAPDRRFALLVLFGPEAHAHLLDGCTTVVVGREPPCEIVVRDSSVSRQHARFSLKNGDISVEDLDSRNGTRWRGQRVRQQKLEPGDEVQVGTARILVVATRTGDEQGADGAPVQEVGRYVIDGPLVKRLYEQVERVAKANVPVLVLGETGSGKEHVAISLHAQSSCSSGPFVVANCGAIPPSLLEATLFGHERGAFTGAVARSVGLLERASGGTLFLDEVGELTMTAQAALLRAVETQRICRVGSPVEVPIDVRFVAATHCDLDAMVQDGAFRKDLYFRLNGVKLLVPPLRERMDEIEALVHVFIERARHEWGARARTISADALDVLSGYGWPGNVRQLRHAIERAALLCAGESIEPSHLPEYVFARPVQPKEAPSLVESFTDLSLRTQVEKFEAALLEEALKRTGGSRKAAARLLRIPLRTLFRKLRVATESDECQS